MPSVEEASGNQSQLTAALRAGLESIDRNASIEFQKYIRLVLPIDGYVFWVKASLVSADSLIAANTFANPSFAAPKLPVSATVAADCCFMANGSLHLETTKVQTEDENYSINKVVFTSEVEIVELNEVSPSVLYIGTFEGTRFAFSRRRSFYRQADIYHYTGDAIYPVMEPQIIDSLAGLNTQEVIVSNSLPIWLYMNQANPIYPYPPTTRIMLYPSFAVPDNLEPPFGVVHIDPEGTEALQAAPIIDRLSQHYQLVSDKVRITFYGLNNNQALAFQDFVNNFSLATDNIGIMNMPVIRDAKRTQVEMTVLAQKKQIDFQISYYQTRANDLARQLILHCIPSFQADDLPFVEANAQAGVYGDAIYGEDIYGTPGLSGAT